MSACDYFTVLDELVDEDEPREHLRAQAEHFVERGRVIADLARPSVRPEAKVLEVGIGFMTAAAALRAHLGAGFELYATELASRRELWDNEHFKRRVEEWAIRARPYDLTSGEPLPFAELFDVIVLADVVEHLPPTDVPAVLELLRDRLAPGGRLVISSTNLPAMYRILSMAFGAGRVFDPPWPMSYGFYGHLHLYGRVDMEALLEHTQLRLLDWRFLNWEIVFVPPRMQLVQKLAARLVPRLSTSWLLAAGRA